MSGLIEGVSNCYVFKSRLQEYAQKVGLPTPVYETVKEGPSHQPCFRSTVIVDNVRYDSLLGFFNRKAAEQSAAEVALMELANTGKLTESVSQPVQETGLCKNLLQEYAQKMNYAIPLYVCLKDESQGRDTLFSCTVDIGGMKYIGAAAKTKKEAEIKAARTALLAIQSSPSCSNETPMGNSVYTVIPSKKNGTDPGISTQESLKPKKKGLFKKKPQRKRRNGEKGNKVQLESMGHSGSGVDIGGYEGQQSDQTANSGLPGMEATMNPEGGPIFNGNRGEKSATRESDVVSCICVDSKDGISQSLGFCQSDLENPNGGDLTSEGEEPRVVDGLNQTACGGVAE
ncbi:hypothetical protein RHSIM_Rhsim06G0071300 [Rhododendron simsii]|uniref:DRBM domain-containing protein n=1 Tax=Rhododendron simsii TaxID=118357 RepID=A0A834GSA9_RHOSS|nr:hypothetical protein RHSIM_Rhsim06G0071300 [Rhododendron simsii]